MKKNKTTQQSIEIHGKYDEVSARPNTRSSLDELLGENLSIYSAKNADEYINQISEMNQTDLHAHAYRIGLVPIPDRKLLVGRLLTEFQKWSSRYNSGPETSSQGQANKISDKAMKILREGA